MTNYRLRRILTGLVMISIILTAIFIQPSNYRYPQPTSQTQNNSSASPAESALAELEVKGRASKTGYSRSQFDDGWQLIGNCDMRNIILARDMTDEVVDLNCKVLSGKLDDPYTGKSIGFQRGPSTSAEVQIDHVVALNDAWQKGAKQLSPLLRQAFANDPLNLLAVDGDQNQKKSGSDAASWLPPYRPFRCSYVARQIAVKQRYNLWVTAAEKTVMINVLDQCPAQQLPKP